MKILFITHRLPCPPDRGCKIRSAAILHWLARHHDVWCAGFLDSSSTPESQAERHCAMTALRHMCRGFVAVPFASRWAGYRAFGSLLGGGTATEGYFSSRHLEKQVMRWSREIGFDAVFAFSSGMAPLALQAAANRRILCMDDLDSRKWQELASAARWPTRTVYGTEARRLARRELQWLASFDATLMIAQREADLVGDPELNRKIRVVPPILPDLPEAGEPLCPVRETGPVVGFVGAMDYEPNVDAACWMARDIWPRIQRNRPDARLMLVGRSPVQAVRDLASDESIVVTGTVPSVHSHLSTMRVHVAPLRISRGVQIKVLTAMAAGRPCVVTSCVAEGLGFRAGRDAVVADSPAAITATILDLLNNPEKAEAIGLAGRQFVRRFDPDLVMRQVERLLSGEEDREPAEGSEQAQSISLPEPVLAGHDNPGGQW